MSAFADPVVAWRGSNDPNAPLVVLLHGRGSNEADIIGLADHLPAGAAYAAVRAPLAEGGGYAWFVNRGIGRPVAESFAYSNTVLSGGNSAAWSARGGGQHQPHRNLDRFAGGPFVLDLTNSAAATHCRRVGAHDSLGGVSRKLRHIGVAPRTAVDPDDGGRPDAASAPRLGQLV